MARTKRRQAAGNLQPISVWMTRTATESEHDKKPKQFDQWKVRDGRETLGNGMSEFEPNQTPHKASRRAAALIMRLLFFPLGFQAGMNNL